MEGSDQAAQGFLEKAFKFIGDLFSGGLSFGAAALIFVCFLIMIGLAYLFGKQKETNKLDTPRPDPEKPEQLEDSTRIAELTDLQELARKDGLDTDSRKAKEIEAELKRKLDDF